MSLHDQLAKAQAEFDSWPEWMRDAARWASPSIRKTGDAGMTDDDILQLQDKVNAEMFGRIGFDAFRLTNRDVWIAFARAVEQRTIERCAAACTEIGDSLDNEWNRGIHIADDLREVAEDCADAIRALGAK